MHHRTSAVIISSLYLFTPMVFSIDMPAQEYRDTKLLAPTETQLSLADYLGAGGPEYPEDTLTIAEIAQGQLDSIFNPLMTEDVDDSVTITKTLNYMKVANTTWPVDEPEVSSDYGWRTPPCPGCSADHRGVDFVPGYGSPVYAVTDGMIVEMGTNGGYGNYIVLNHLVANTDGEIDEWTTLYAHLKNNSFVDGLKIGSVVRTGEKLAEVGSTGLSTGPHLHFELLINGEYVDPMPLLGTYEVVVVEESDHDDWLFLGETFKVVETEITYK